MKHKLCGTGKEPASATQTAHPQTGFTENMSIYENRANMLTFTAISVWKQCQNLYVCPLIFKFASFIVDHSIQTVPCSLTCWFLLQPALVKMDIHLLLANRQRQSWCTLLQKIIFSVDNDWESSQLAWD